MIARPKMSQNERKTTEIRAWQSWPTSHPFPAQARTFDSARALVGLDLRPPTSRRHPRPPRYTAPWVALRAALRRAAHGNETFEVAFAALPGRSGDEAWRATATALDVTAAFEGGALASCAPRDSLYCGDLERDGDRPAPAPPSYGAAFLAYPVLDDFREELVCVG